MSTTGKLNNNRARYISIKELEGFTLLELSIAILLIGFMLSFTLPKLRDVALSDTLKKTVRTMNDAIVEIRYQAIRDNQEYFLVFDFGSNRFWTYSPYFTDEERIVAKENYFSLPSDVRILDISIKNDEMKNSGEVGISFSKEGYIMPSVIHLGSDDGRRFTFILRPFLGDVDVLEEYVEIEDIKM